MLLAWATLAWGGMGPAGECIVDVDSGERYASLVQAQQAGASSVRVECLHLEVGLFAFEPLDVTVEHGATLLMCPEPNPFASFIPAVSFGAKWSIDVVDGEAIMVGLGGGAALVYEDVEVVLTGVQATGEWAACSSLGPRPPDDLYEDYPLYEVAGSLSLNGGEVRDAHGVDAGGVLVRWGGVFTAENTTFQDLTGELAGAILSAGALELREAHLEHNGGLFGGGLLVAGGSATANGGEFVDNQAWLGGAVYVGGLPTEDETILPVALSTVVFDGVDFEDNHALSGSAMWHDGLMSVAVKAGTFDSNVDLFDTTGPTYATGTGWIEGVVASAGGLTLETSTFSNNESYWGAVVTVGGDSTVRDVTVMGNKALGGLEVLRDGDVLMEGVYLRDNGVDDFPDFAELFVGRRARVEGGGLRMCTTGTGTSSVFLETSSELDLNGVLAHGVRSFVTGPGEADLEHATIVVDGPGNPVFEGPTTLLKSVVSAPGRALGGVDQVEELLVDVQSHALADPSDVLAGPVWWMRPDDFDDLDPCDARLWRPYPGTQGSYTLGELAPLRRMGDDWGAFGRSLSIWDHPMEDVEDWTGATDYDGDGASWPQDCDDHDDQRSGIQKERCDDGDVDNNCYGGTGASGASERWFGVDYDLDGVLARVQACEPPPGGEEPPAADGPRDCIDYDPEERGTTEVWVDLDGDGVHALRLGCPEEDLGPSTPPDCDDSDATRWRMGKRYVDEDDDDVSPEPSGLESTCIGDEAPVSLDGVWDCDDGDGERTPGKVDVPDDGIDQDCDEASAATYVAGGCHTAATEVRWAWMGRRRGSGDDVTVRP